MLKTNIQQIYDNVEENYTKFSWDISNSKDVLLWGAGWYCEFCIDYLQSAGFNVIGIIDKSERKLGGY